MMTTTTIANITVDPFTNMWAGKLTCRDRCGYPTNCGTGWHVDYDQLYDEANPIYTDIGYHGGDYQIDPVYKEAVTTHLKELLDLTSRHRENAIQFFVEMWDYFIAHHSTQLCSIDIVGLGMVSFSDYDATLMSLRVYDAPYSEDKKGQYFRITPFPEVEETTEK